MDSSWRHPHTILITEEGREVAEVEIRQGAQLTHRAFLVSVSSSLLASSLASVASSRFILAPVTCSVHLSARLRYAWLLLRRA